jgi:hypothetical protein
MDRAELESKVVTILGRFDALPYITVCRMALMDGNYTIANETLLKEVLAGLVQQGVLRLTGEWGPFQLVKPDSRRRPRLRAYGASSKNAERESLHGV